ncbi:DNA-binding protein RFX6, partial [Geodia barretti]
QAIVDLVVICDFILYRTLCEVLIPASLQSLPDNLIEEITVFSHNIVEWVFNALQDLPAALGIRKVQTCEMFGKSLRR